MTKDAVTSFLNAARRRLWLETMLRQLRIALWIMSAVLVLLAIVHVGWGPVRFGFALSAATIAGVIALSPTLFWRPSLTDCALRADRHFNGYSVITTAHELGQKIEIRPAGKTVLAVADSTVADWRPRLGTLWQSPHGTSFVFAVVPAFVAALLLQLPPRDASSVTTIDEQFGLLGGAQTGTDLFDDNSSELPELRDAIVRSTINEDTPPQADRNRRDNASPVRGDAGPNAALEPVEVAEDLPPGLAGTTNEGGNNPGDARRNDDEVEQQLADAGPLFSQRVDTAVTRRGAEFAGRTGGGDVFATEAQDSRVGRIDIAPTPLSSSEWTTLTVAEVAYAKRYLDAAGSQVE